MKKAFLSIIVSLLVIDGISQVIEGMVFNKVTQEEIHGASVYFEGTSAGTLSDQAGRFRLNVSKFSSLPLTVSALGYNSSTVRDFNSDKPVKVYLEPKLIEIEEVIVSARSRVKERQRMLAIFRREFLGATANALSCTITNENDIRLRYSEKGDTLKAYSSAPVHIINKALGYELDYFLDKFQYCPGSNYISYKGTILFREDSTIYGEEKMKVDRRRKFAYLGSRMHFLRSLWIDDLNSAGFAAYNTSEKKVDYSDIVYQKDLHTKFLHSKDKLGISYYNKKPTSQIRFLTEMVYLDPSGYFDADAIIWEGEMSQQRIADTLPFDYVYSN